MKCLLAKVASLYLIYLYTCRHSPGWVQSASSVELPTSRMEALQARWTCTSSLETFTNSFFHPAHPKTQSPHGGFRLSLTVADHVFSWPPAHFRHERSSAGKMRSLISSPSGRLAAWPNQRSLVWSNCAYMQN